MAPPRKLPPIEELAKLARVLTRAEIAARFAVTVDAVDKVFRKAGLTNPAEVAHTIPWRVKVEHAHVYPATMLRYLARKQRGETLTEKESAMLEAWLGSLQASSAVVYYNPDVPPNPASPQSGGWAYVPALPGEDVIREPPKALRR